MFDLIVAFILNCLKGLMIESSENGQFSLKILQMIVYLYFTFNKIYFGRGKCGLGAGSLGGGGGGVLSPPRTCDI
jgi:hypothetical protein